MLKTARLALKMLPILGLLLLFGASFSLPGSDSKDKQESKLKVIDTGGPVVISKCLPCHRDLNDFENPNLINFNHSVHFKRGIRCEACHTEFPHTADKILKPTMDLCVNCHRLQHGSQGAVAPPKCGLCHPPGFKLTPDDHDREDFPTRGHIDRANRDMQKCLVCHDKDSCEGCHAEKGVAPRPATDYTWFSLWPIPKDKGPKITVGGKVEMATCAPCHKDLQRWKNDKLVNFNHPKHFERGITCENCHDQWPHAKGKTIKPKMASCAKCHRLDHGSQGKLVKRENSDMSDYCFLCHPREMKLKPDWHTDAFVDGAHKNKAIADRGLCRMCHVQAFCDSCHQTEIPHASGWRGDHGQEAVAQAEYSDPLPCMKCHETEPSDRKAPSCAKCHKASVYPHPKPWAPQHGKLSEEFGVAACETCHRKTAFCDKCHGAIEMPHVETWLGEHPRFLRDNEVDICLSCHVKSQCEECHAIHGVHNQYTNFDYQRGGVKP